MMYLFITFTFEGFHQYSEAPAEVSYLCHPHRHLFHVKVYIPVDDLSSRELEFIMIKNTIQSKLPAFVNLSDTGSCEDICRRISDMAYALYRLRCPVEVSEDGENGALYIPKF
mgnify:CR=1 FL=1